MKNEQNGQHQGAPRASKVNEADLTWEDRQSPEGTYRLAQQNATLALGGIKDVGTWGGGHPFDVAKVRMPVGAINFPRHVHSSTWEYYMFISGRGAADVDDVTHDVGPGDHVVCPPGCAHRIRNNGDEDLVFYVIANNPTSEVIYYPDSDKWMVKPQRKFFRMNEVDYYDDEE